MVRIPYVIVELFDRFVDTSLPADQFHHQQHVHVAWLFVQQYGMPDALGEFTAAIKRFADAKGATGLYHETITWAFLLLIAERAGPDIRRRHGRSSRRRIPICWCGSRRFSSAIIRRSCWRPTSHRRTFLMPDLHMTFPPS